MIRLPTSVASLVKLTGATSVLKQNYLLSVIKKDDSPGNYFSLDHLMISVKGIKLQSVGKLASVPITGDQIFADHCCKPPFLHAQLLTYFTLDSTICAKFLFERCATKHNVSIRRYRGDNGRFGDTGFNSACADSLQTLELCDVNDHHQNGIAESIIGHLQTKTRSILLRTINLCLEMMSIEL